MRRIVEVKREPGDGLFDYGDVVFRYDNGATGVATISKEALRVQRLSEKMVDSGVPEKDVLELVEASHEEGWRSFESSHLED